MRRALPVTLSPSRTTRCKVFDFCEITQEEGATMVSRALERRFWWLRGKLMVHDARRGVSASCCCLQRELRLRALKTLSEKRERERYGKDIITTEYLEVFYKKIF